MSHKDNRNVLVVEDQSLLNQLLSMELDDLGFTTDSVFNGKQALSKIADKEYEAIITDLFMPEMDGITLVKEIRNRGIKTPIIVVSASDMDEVKDQLRQFSPIEFIDKPINDVKFKQLEQYLTSWTS